MNYLQIRKNCTGYNMSCLHEVEGIPVRHGTDVHFKRGIPGFEQISRWRFTADAAIHPFVYMNALDDSVRFVCVETFRICPSYQLHLPYPDSEQLKITPVTNVALLSIVTVRTDPKETTANLMSPIVINLDNLEAQQLISDRSQYPLKYRIWNSLRLYEANEELETEAEELAVV